MRPAAPFVLVALLLLAALPARSQQTLPAVDGLSGKLMFSRGAADGDNWTGLEGAVTLPIGNRFGLQIDAAAGGVDGTLGKSAFYGGGAHLFWRDPSQGMIGIEGGFAHLDALGGVSFYSLGVEAERYWGALTLGGLVGITDGSDANRMTALGQFDLDLKTRFVAASSLTWYPDENLALTVSAALAGSDVTAGVGVEWALPSESWAQPSLFARALLREGGDVSALAGLSLYFGGQSKPLIRRHREDDPTIGNVMSLGSKAGIGFTLGAFCKFRQHRDNPCRNPAQAALR